MDDEEQRLVFAILTIYQVLLFGGLVLGSPWWLIQMLVKGRYRAGLAGRLGLIPDDLRAACAGERGPGWIWVHAVSVGEVLAAFEVVQATLQAGFRVAVSTTTEAGQVLAKERFKDSPVFYMPLDFQALIGRYLDLISPRLVVTMESELWPNLIHCCRVKRIPLSVVNARISDRSFPRYMRLRPFWRPFLREISLFLAQSAETADRLRQLGVDADRLRVSGNLKFNVRVEGPSELTTRVAEALGGSKVVVCGSTLPGEEALLMESWADVAGALDRTTLLLAPRHLDRTAEVLDLVQRRGFTAMRCSDLVKNTHVPRGAVLVLDTIGDLASMYAIGSVAFVGGSLVPKGGHNPLEPARFGVPVIMGESFFNFRESVSRMIELDAVRIVHKGELSAALLELLADGESMGERGRRVFEGQSGATERTVAALLELMEAKR